MALLMIVFTSPIRRRPFHCDRKVVVTFQVSKCSNIPICRQLHTTAVVPRLAHSTVASWQTSAHVSSCLCLRRRLCCLCAGNRRVVAESDSTLECHMSAMTREGDPEVWRVRLPDSDVASPRAESVDSFRRRRRERRRRRRRVHRFLSSITRSDCPPTLHYYTLFHLFCLDNSQVGKVV